MIRLETERLILREWRKADIRPFSDMNRDDRIMAFFPFHLNLTEAESLKMINVFCDRMEEEKGFLYLPLIEKSSGSFLGMLNLTPVMFDAHFTPAVEIGWRLVFDCWGKGYATEAASGLMEYGFSKLQLQEIVSFTAIGNIKSSAVMKRLGMTYAGEFDHPGLPQENELRRHDLYRIAAPLT